MQIMDLRESSSSESSAVSWEKDAASLEGLNSLSNAGQRKVTGVRESVWSISIAVAFAVMSRRAAQDIIGSSRFPPRTEELCRRQSSRLLGHTLKPKRSGLFANWATRTSGDVP
jgi:hypothetical protein